jgi:hypothetical protein
VDVFSTELGIRLSFVKTSKFRGGGEPPPPPHPSARLCLQHHRMYKFARLVQYIGSEGERPKLGNYSTSFFVSFLTLFVYFSAILSFSLLLSVDFAMYRVCFFYVFRPYFLHFFFPSSP